MTETEWLAATRSRDGVDYLCSPAVSAHRRKAGRRKLRLFLCACCRRIWDLIPKGAFRKAVETGERICEGIAVARSSSDLVNREGRGPRSRRYASCSAAMCVETNISSAVVVGAAYASCAAGWKRLEAVGGEDMEIYRPGEADEQRAQVDLLHEMFGNPIRPVKLDPAWLRWNDRTVVTMAQAIYDERAFDRLPILGDALTDAGCDDERLLTHCRSDGPHQRGCWAVDLLLGR